MNGFAGFLFGAVLGLGTVMVAQGHSGAPRPGLLLGCPGGPVTSIQFNDSGACGGSAGLTWDGTGLSFPGIANPIRVFGGDDTEGDTALVFDNPIDHYIALRMLYGTDIVSDNRLALWSNYPDYPATAKVELTADNSVQVFAGPHGSVPGGHLLLRTANGGDSFVSLSGGAIDITGTSDIRLLNDGGGHVFVSDLTATGAATGKKVVCVDTATGQLYASSSSAGCAD